MIAWYWSYLLTVVSCIGFFIAARKPFVGWTINLLSEILWLVYAIVTRQWGFIIGAVLFSIVFILNMRKALRA